MSAKSPGWRRAAQRGTPTRPRRRRSRIGRRPRRAAVAAAAACFACAASTLPLRAEDWRLMGREGGCVTLDAAADRLPLLAGIATPDELVARLRRQGEEVHRRDIAQGDATAVLVEAPALELGLIFVPPSACR